MFVYKRGMSLLYTSSILSKSSEIIGSIADELATITAEASSERHVSTRMY
jgi:hypothetical protein